MDNPHVASFPHCGKEFTYENLVGLYGQRVADIRFDSGVFDAASVDTARIRKSRIHAMCINFQKDIGGTIDESTKFAVNAIHVSGCFRCQKTAKESNHVCGLSQNCECRYRLPDRRRKKARIRVLKEDNKWFEWNGNEKLQPIVEVLPK
jgi:hypothetical protein